MDDFTEYIEMLAKKHKLLLHGTNGCHFSAMADDSESKMASIMKYPCVVVDAGDFTVAGSSGNIRIVDDFSVLFLTHVADTGKNTELSSAFALTRKIMISFMRRFSRDKKALLYPFLDRFSLDGSEGHRIEMKDSALFGWALFFNSESLFTDRDCDNDFND